MTRRLVPTLIAAFLISGVFTFWLSHHATRPVAAATTAHGLRYVAAAKDLQAGELLVAAATTLTDWPASRPVQGAFGKQEELAGRVLLLPISAGELIVEHALAPVGAGAGLTAKIPAGLRAISLSSDEVAGVSGFLLPGSYVDVLVTYHPPATPDFITTTVLQSVRVLAAGQKIEPDADGRPSTTSVVTLLATPQDAEKLTLASSLGKIHFVLRNGADRAELNDLVPQLGLSGETAPVKQFAKRNTVHKSSYTVHTITGGKHTEESFEGKAKE